MFIEQPPTLYRSLYRRGIWRIPCREKPTVYLTFDDGPIPEITPWVLDTLKRYGIKATFFCVGENVYRHPHLLQQIKAEQHATGNHTYNHLQGMRTRTGRYMENVEKAQQLLDTSLFRPPHGHIRLPQWNELSRKYRVVFWDVVTRDYSKYITAQKVVDNVKRYARNGSIIVFHDSLKAKQNLLEALPQSIEWLLEQGYSFATIEQGISEI
jgi:peptidoglycan/xylan/chitin deacetylase (PgdA/CDA1 family)